MMTHQPQFSEAWFAQLFAAIDQLHDAVSDERPGGMPLMAPVDMVGWLEDIIYTAQEAITEIQAKCLSVTGAGYSGAESEDRHGFGSN